jgi:hypothetical protein
MYVTPAVLTEMSNRRNYSKSKIVISKPNINNLCFKFLQKMGYNIKKPEVDCSNEASFPVFDNTNMPSNQNHQSRITFASSGSCDV